MISPPAFYFVDAGLQFARVTLRVTARPETAMRLTKGFVGPSHPIWTPDVRYNSGPPSPDRVGWFHPKGAMWKACAAR